MGGNSHALPHALPHPTIHTDHTQPDIAAEILAIPPTTLVVKRYPTLCPKSKCPRLSSAQCLAAPAPAPLSAPPAGSLAVSEFPFPACASQCVRTGHRAGPAAGESAPRARQAGPSESEPERGRLAESVSSF